MLYDIITERQGWLNGSRSADAHLFRSEKQIRMPKSQLTASFAPETPAWPLSALLRTAAAVPASLSPPEQQLGRCGIVMPHLAWSCPTVQSAPLGTVTSATVKDAWLSFEAPHICNRGSHFSACKSPKKLQLQSAQRFPVLTFGLRNVLLSVADKCHNDFGNASIVEDLR